MRVKIKYQQLFFFLIFLTVSCTDKYKEGIKYYNEKSYYAALRFLRDVENTHKNYKLAQIKIAEIDSILRPIKLQEARQDSISQVEMKIKQLEDFKAQLNREIDSIKTFDGSKYRDDISSIQIEIALFGAWAKIIKDAKNHTNKDINRLGESLKSKVMSLQISEFPKLRNNYGEVLKQKLWIETIKVRTKDTGHTTLEFEGGIFASNKNKQDTQNSLNEILNLLRFKRINYKWYEYDDDYTYYSLKTESDGTLVDF